MLRVEKFLYLIFIAIVVGGCSKTAAPPTTTSKTSAAIAPSGPSSINVDRVRTRLAETLLLRGQGRELIARKSLDQQAKIYQEIVKNNPQDISALNRLAHVYIRKVRQSADFSYNSSAEKLLKQALTIDPKNFDSLLFMSMVHMAQHQFADSRDLALKAISVNAYGVGAYGILGDAYYELGFYQQAAEAYDKMGDLGPGSPYYARIAQYRALAGDPNEAMEIMREAFETSNPDDREDHAWYLLQLGNLAFDSGKTKSAEMYFRQSLQVYSESYNALAGLAKVRLAQGHPEEAITLYDKAMAIVPMPEFAAALGDIYASLSRTEDAKQQYELVEYIGLISEINQEIYNRQIALFYADHNKKLDEALKLVQDEIVIRKDVYGYDALAWCLYKNGKIAESVEAMQEALRMKTQDAKLFYHAGVIYSAAGRTTEAIEFLKKALAIQPHFHPLYASKAEEMIHKLKVAS